MSHNKHNQTEASGSLGELQLIRNAEVKKLLAIDDVALWRLERAGELAPLRIGRRKFYALADLRTFIDRARARPPGKVPWSTSRPGGTGS